jgi:hypothetical protein
VAELAYPGRIEAVIVRAAGSSFSRIQPGLHGGERIALGRRGAERSHDDEAAKPDDSASANTAAPLVGDELTT